MQNTPKPTAAANPDGLPVTIRLNKRMAERGLCSRREADVWIANGWVRVNRAAAVMGQPADWDLAAQPAPDYGVDRPGTALLRARRGFLGGGRALPRGRQLASCG
jgi:hypothetical protein